MAMMKSQGPIPAPDLAPVEVCILVVPIPAPNAQLDPVTIPTQFAVFVMMMPAHNMTAIKPVSIGTPGAGVASGTGMGPVRYILGSFSTFTGGPPTVRMLDPTLHNSTNMVGMDLAPTQVTVIVLG